MDLIFSTQEFKIQGVSYPDFPVLVRKDGDIFVEALEFLIYYCIKRGRVQSYRSWETFGRDIYDYFAFLEANNLDWKKIQSRQDETLLAIYRDASMSYFNIGATTINRRLRLAIQFYQYAYNHGWVKTLPYELEAVTVRKPKQFLAHTDTSGGLKARPDVMLKQPRTKIKVLNAEQVKSLLSAINNKTLLLMVRLALATGLRKEEILTFPTKYVVNPHTVQCRSHIVVNLTPGEIKTKGSEPRSIHVPVSVMSALWDYVLHERHQLLIAKENPTDKLFVNRYGKSWSLKSKAFNNELAKLSLPYSVNPHMLRHTYATHTLKSLRTRNDLAFDPLIYVRDRLGHSSISTTERYLHFLHEIEDDLITEYQLEVDAICDEVAA
ncbi:tyrosine-type recombinase/integrase [Photobacterium kasasachensis]|uniref:tyrosine-type recombinase/integrase n=1 Tax=Photobacterium kasasachensis TaxID=2910240 RepID=UPI003D0D79D7